MSSFLITLPLVLSLFLPVVFGTNDPQLVAANRLIAQATIPVTVFSDDLEVNGNCTLREAVQAANFNQAVDACPAGKGADTILLRAGEYRLQLPNLEEAEDGNLSGDLDISASVTVRGAGPTKTHINANDLDRLVDVLAPEAEVTFEGVRLFNGRVIYSPTSWAGGIYNRGRLILKKSAVEDNVTSESGGGIISENYLKVLDSRICNNHTESEEGGGVINTGQMEVEGSLICSNATPVTSGEGGGILNRGQLSIRTSTLTGNAGVLGGAIVNYGELVMEYVTVSESVTRHVGGALLMAGGSAELWNVDFLDNSSGAIHMEEGSLTLHDSTINNSGLEPFQDLEGTAIFQGGGSLMIDHSTIRNSNTAYGGGLILRGGEFHMALSTVSGNSGSLENRDNTGGVAVNGAQASLSNVTITNNRSGSAYGGGFHVGGGSLTVANSLIADNLDANGQPTVDCTQTGGTLDSSFNNLIGRDGCSFPEGPNDLIGTLENPVDPRLLPLADNGGPTWTHALQPASPAIDAGDSCGPVDQRSVRRVDGQCDLGAYEEVGPNLIPIEIDILPGDPFNTLPAGKTQVSVAILNWLDGAGQTGFGMGTGSFNIGLTFGKTGNENSLIWRTAKIPSCLPRDVNGDGLLDLVCNFNVQKTGLPTCAPGGSERTEAYLEMWLDGIRWEGRDYWTAPACGQP